MPWGEQCHAYIPPGPGYAPGDVMRAFGIYAKRFTRKDFTKCEILARNVCLRQRFLREELFSIVRLLLGE